MKRKLSPIYYIIPVLYIGVILFFVFMQFQAREEFGEKVGSLSVSGVYAKTLGGRQRMRHIEVRFHDLQMDFSQSSSAIAGFGSLRRRSFPWNPSVNSPMVLKSLSVTILLCDLL